MVECNLPKVDVAGSSPVVRLSIFSLFKPLTRISKQASLQELRFTRRFASQIAGTLRLIHLRSFRKSYFLTHFKYFLSFGIGFKNPFFTKNPAYFLGLNTAISSVTCFKPSKSALPTFLYCLSSL